MKASLLNFIVLFIFTVESYAWASGPLQLAVDHFNNLPDTEKLLMIKKIASLHSEDVNTFKEHEKALSNFKWPKLNLTGEKVNFTLEGKFFELASLHPQNKSFKLNGLKLMKKPGNLKSMLQLAEEHLSRPKVTFSNYFISHAHAFLPAIFLIVAAVLLGIILISIIAGLANEYGTEELKAIEDCEKFKSKIAKIPIEDLKDSIVDLLNIQIKQMNSILNNKTACLPGGKKCDLKARLKSCITDVDGLVKRKKKLNSAKINDQMYIKERATIKERPVSQSTAQ